MTLGDKPDLSIHAHPITRKVWLEVPRMKYTAEVFEDGYVIVFDEFTIRKHTRKYTSQRIAVEKMKEEGWIYWV